jgi:heat shock protein HslJ
MAIDVRCRKANRESRSFLERRPLWALLALLAVLAFGCGSQPMTPAPGARQQAVDGPGTGSPSKAETASVSEHGKALPESQPVREPELPFTARGQEPGWMITIDASTISLNSDYGSLQLSMPRTEPQATAEGIRYSTEEGGRRLEVFIRQEICADVATGMPHPYQVRYELDGKGHAGCGGDPNALLTGGEWTVQSIDGVPVIEKSHVTIVFLEDWRVAGSASCNRFIGGYRLTGEGLSFSQMGTTMMACDDHLSQQESRFLEVLQAVSRFEISPEGHLVLHTPDQRSVTGHR